MPGRQIIIDVAHNTQAVEAVMSEIQRRFSHVNRVKVVFAVSFKKILKETLDILEKNERVKDVYVVGSDHFKLLGPEEAHLRVESIGCSKLRPLVTDGSKSNI